MWLKEITVSNYKAIREMSIGFQQGVNLLIGDNGVGKTSVLEAITVAFGDFINGMSGVAKKGISSNDVRMDTKMISDASQGIIHYTPITITSIFYTEDGEKNGEVTRRDETAKSKTRFLGKQISDYVNKKVNEVPAKTAATVIPGFVDFSRNNNGSRKLVVQFILVINYFSPVRHNYFSSSE